MNLTCVRARTKGTWIGVGAGIGVAFGTATHAVGFGLALGGAIGALADGLLATCATRLANRRPHDGGHNR